MNNFTLSPTDPRPPGPTLNARLGSEQGEKQQNRMVIATVNALKPTERERDVCNNLVLDRQQTECCKAFLRSQSLDNDARCCQLIPYNTQRYNRNREIPFHEPHPMKQHYKREISCDSVGTEGEKRGSAPDSGIKGKGDGVKRGGNEILEKKDKPRSGVNKNMRTKRDDSFDSLLSSENEKSLSISRSLRNSVREDSLDSVSSGRSLRDSAPPSPTQPKKSINCMVADIVGLVRRIKRLRFSHETHV